MFFLILFSILLVLVIGGSVYLVRGFHQFSCINALAKKHSKIAWMLSFLPVIILIIVGVFNIYTGIVSAIHLIIIWLLCNGIVSLIPKFSKKEIRKDIAGITAICVTTVLMVIGWYTAHNVVETYYTFQTEKAIGTDKLRIVEIADAHLGVTLNGEQFAAEMQKISALQPDIVAVVGDFVDDESTRKDMEIAAKALGEISPQYGTFYVFGNHDRGYSPETCDFNTDDLISVLETNHVTVLKDETIQLDNGIALIGREDKSRKNRLPITELTPNIDTDTYSIVLDHQPNDYDAEAAANVDLVLSGHTHGGQFFPCGPIGVLIGANDAYYGHHLRSNTDFIITSGISAWSIPLKTGTVSEYVVIDVVHSKNIES